MAQLVDTLLLNGLVVTMDSDYAVIENGGVAVKENEIVAVGTSDEIANAYTAPKTIDCTDKIIIPGLINAHTHVPMTLLRGLNDDLRLDVWLGYLMPVEREFVTPDFVRLGTQIACAEMIRSGITTFNDMYYFESDIAKATAEIGMRAILGETVLMFPAPDAAAYEEALEYCRQFIEEWQGHELIQPAVAPHAWYTATPELLSACADLARAYNVPLHTHVSETAIEVENCRNQHDMPVVPWIKKHGLLETKLICAHCVHIDRDEVKRLISADAGIAHNPSSNLKLSSGIAPVAEWLEQGAKVGLGTDGTASNNDLDMFEEMRLAAFIAKIKRNDPTDLPAREALALATRRGADALHMGDKIGSIEQGKRADLAVLHLDGIHNWPYFKSNPDGIYSRIVYAAKSTDVTDVMCNGQWLMRDQNLLTVDEEAAKKAAAEVAERIDQFVIDRESSPYNKLIVLEGVTRQESYEVQIKVPLATVDAVKQKLEASGFEITKRSLYKQYDTYFLFDDQYVDAWRLRFREDEVIDEEGNILSARSRLTLMGETDRDEFPNAVMLSRSRWLANANNTRRFYREYFSPDEELEVNKMRRRYTILYEGTEFKINLDQVLKPQVEGFFLEIKARTWSRSDAERKAEMIAQLLDELGVGKEAAVTREYADLALEAG